MEFKGTVAGTVDDLPAKLAGTVAGTVAIMFQALLKESDSKQNIKNEKWLRKKK